jgi:hypothetical protein
MAFVTGLLLIDAPASALNNLGNIPDERLENTSGVKVIRTREGFFPYVSAQGISLLAPYYCSEPCRRLEGGSYP